LLGPIHMSDRAIVAVLLAIVLGIFFGYLVATSNYAGIYLFFFACLFCPLVVSLIADQFTILLALIPNPLLIFTRLIIGEIQHPHEQHFGIQTISGAFGVYNSIVIRFRACLLRKKDADGETGFSFVGGPTNRLDASRDSLFLMMLY